MRRLLVYLLPPIFIKFIIFISNIGRSNPKYGFFGNFSSWSNAQRLAAGYDSDIILSKVQKASWLVKTGKAKYERDSVLFNEIQYSWFLLAGLLWITSKNSNRLNIIDFGGSLGTSYYQNYKFLGHLTLLRWNIVEQKKFVDIGKKYFSDKNLKFYYSIKDCLRTQKANAILFSGVVQYIENPYDLLDKTVSYDFDYIIFDRTPFIDSLNDRITIQIVRPEIYPASYPAWFFNEKKFTQFFKRRGYEIVANYTEYPDNNILLQDGKIVANKGYIFKRQKIERY